MQLRRETAGVLQRQIGDGAYLTPDPFLTVEQFEQITPVDRHEQTAREVQPDVAREGAGLGDGRADGVLERGDVGVIGRAQRLDEGWKLSDGGLDEPHVFLRRPKGRAAEQGGDRVGGLHEITDCG